LLSKAGKEEFSTGFPGRGESGIQEAGKERISQESRDAGKSKNGAIWNPGNHERGRHRICRF
jgi:hypothetical protein